MKSNAHFHFKQFSVAHDKSTHKIGTDGVLLGAWVDVKNAGQILDVGTGTGVIALMLAQRSSDHTAIDAVEIEKEDADQAMENVQHSPWPQKIKVHHTSLQEFSQGNKKYDLIVSNPPYFINSWLPPEKKRSQARHTHELSFDDLLQCSERLLNEHGRLAVILPYQEAIQFIALAKQHRLFPARQLSFRSRQHKPVERLVLEFTRHNVKPAEEELILHGETNEWSDDYCRLTRGFYLKI